MPKEASVTVTLSHSSGEALERFAVFGRDTTSVELAALVRDTVENHYASGEAPRGSDYFTSRGVAKETTSVDEACDALDAANDHLKAALDRLKATLEELR